MRLGLAIPLFFSVVFCVTGCSRRSTDRYDLSRTDAALPADADGPSPDAEGDAASEADAFGLPDAAMDAEVYPDAGDGRECVHEVCGNGVDDNCDGVVDDGCPCSPGERASCFRGVPAHRGVGLCADGEMVCAGGEFGAWGPCVGDVLERAETCEPEGLDEDCDGEADEGDVCPHFPPLAMCPELIATETGALVELRGDGSDPDEGDVSFVWTVVTRPAGSSAEPSEPNFAQTTFSPDEPGAYELELCVTDVDGEVACCRTSLEVERACEPPTKPTLSSCGASWDRRPIVEFSPLPSGLVYELLLDDAESPFGVVTQPGQNYFRPAAPIALGGPPPGVSSTISVRSCRSDDRTCCSDAATGSVLLVEACTTPRAPNLGELIFSEYIIDGDGACPGASCEAGEAFEITNLSNCPITLDDTHFFYCNGSCSPASYRWMNFDESAVVPPRGVYVAIREQSRSACSYPFFGDDDAGLFGLRVSTLDMQGDNLANGWFSNGGGSLRLAFGEYVGSESEGTLESTSYRSPLTAPTCGSNGYDALNRCGDPNLGTRTFGDIDENQLGRLWHPCDAVLAPVPASCRDDALAGRGASGGPETRP